MNVEKAFMYGFEAGLEVQFLKKFSFSLGAAYTYAQNISWDEPLSEIPPFAVNTSLNYKGEKLEAALSSRIVAKQARISESFSETETPGFTVTDFKIFYTPFNMLKLYFSATNIFDVNYVEHLSRAYKNMDVQSLYYEPGRSFNIGMKLNF
ncbi:MAG: TonB-dependent receptor, partial [Bacteroidota bacterium]|nr:TonB-dependent receptor [Bacteroidota bacterium]